jgi:hypothetical protein
VSTLRVVSNIEYAKVFRSFNGMVPMTETTIIDVPNFAFSGNAERLHGSTWHCFASYTFCKCKVPDESSQGSHT